MTERRERQRIRNKREGEKGKTGMERELTSIFHE
jgi:hypothetical protein